jgi:hypothetical protein
VTPRRPASDALIGRILLLWAGIAVGVAFVATPAKFLAPSLSLPVALDVGRHTFAVFNRIELLLLAALLLASLFAARRRRWLLTLAVAGAVVLAQALWMIPELDARVAAILAGRPPARPSALHGAYIGAEALKIAALALGGLVPLKPRV